jgi:hypothetical protein
MKIMKTIFALLLTLFLISPLYAGGGASLPVTLTGTGGGGGYTLEQTLGDETETDLYFVAAGGGSAWLAGCFTTSGAYTLTKLEVDGAKEASAGVATTAYIYSYDSGTGKPLASLATATNTVAASALDTGFKSPYAAAYTFTGVSLSATTTYCAAIQATGAEGGYMRVANKTSTGVAVNTSSDGATWTVASASYQLAMKTYSGGP